MLFTGKPRKPKDLDVILQTTISVSVRWKAGFNGGFGPQMFRLEYKKSAESGKFEFSLNYTEVAGVGNKGLGREEQNKFSEKC